MFLLHRVNGWLGVRAQEIRLVHEDIELFPGLILKMMMLMVVMEMVIIMIAHVYCIFTIYQVQFYGLIHQMPRISMGTVIILILQTRKLKAQRFRALLCHITQLQGYLSFSLGLCTWGPLEVYRVQPVLCLITQLCLIPCATIWTVAHQAPLPMGVLQARILKWVAMPSSRGSPQPRDQIQVSCIAGRFFTA